MQTISVLLDEMGEYIQHAAVEAADYLSKKDLKLYPFEGSYIEFDKDFCASIYRDMISELITNNRAALFKYGMFALVVAMKAEDGLIFGLHLGVCFSDPSVETIGRVGPGGHYLTDELTLELLRSDEFFDNEVFDYSGTCGPYPSMLERAHEKAEAIVADFESPVSGNVQEALRRFFHDEYARLEA